MVMDEEARNTLLPESPTRARRTKADAFAALRRELVSLERTLKFQEERVELVDSVAQSVEEENKEVQRKIHEYKSKLSTMETHKAYIIKKQQLVDAQKVESALTAKLDELTAAYKTGEASLHRQMKEQKQILTVRRRQLHALAGQRGLEDEASGPECLQFLRSDWWQMLSAVVILLNVACMFVKYTHPELNFSEADIIFLAFYNVEVVLKIAYFQTHFFSGKMSVVGWNWLDIVVVVFGDLEIILSTMTGRGGSSFGCLRILRLSRLGRLARAAKVWLTTDLSWTQTPRFESFMMMAICANCLIMGFECEYPEGGIWIFAENLLLLLYVFELLVRMKLDGWAFFCGENPTELVWNYLDFFIVLGGVVDTWVLAVISKLEPSLDLFANAEIGEVVSIIRMLRLLRILRLVEIIKNYGPLYTLVVGIAKAMQGMGWALLLAAGLLYISAIVTVRASSGVSGWVSDQADNALKRTFTRLPEAVFALFQVMNADFSGVESVLDTIPATRYLVMAFMIITNWAVFSILTAVVSDKMAVVTDQHLEMQHSASEKALRDEKEASIEALFRRLDADHDGLLTQEEFKSLITDPMLAEELSAYAALPASDMDDIFDLIAFRSDDHRDCISHDQFLRLLVMENLPITARPLLKLNKRLMRMGAWLEDNMGRFQNLDGEANPEGTGDISAAKSDSGSSSSSFD